MLSKDLEYTLNQAFKNARAKRHEYMTVEHLLLALSVGESGSTWMSLMGCGANLEVLRADLSSFLEDTTPVLPEEIEERETMPTLGFQRVLQRAVFPCAVLGEAGSYRC